MPLRPTAPLALGLALLLTAPACTTPSPAPQPTKKTMTQPTPPVAAKRPRELTHHGDTRVDPYYWLRDKKDPEVIRYLEAENAYTDAVMAPTASLQKTLYDEMIGRIKQTDMAVPYLKNGYWYYSRTQEGKNYRIYCRRAGTMEAPEEVILDANALAAGQTYFRLGRMAISPNNELLAYSVDSAGNEQYTLYIKNLRTGALIGKPIAGTGGSVEWGNDNATLLYTKLDATNRPYQLYRHLMDAPDGTADALLHEERDEAFFLGLGKSRSQKYLFMSLGSKVTDEVWLLDADAPRGALRVVAPRKQDVEYNVTHHGEHLYIVTNAGGATNFKLMRAPVATPGADHWQEVIAHDPQIMLRWVEAFRDFLVIVERRGGLTNLRVRRMSDGQTHDVAFQEKVFTVGVGTNADYNTSTVRLEYTSLTTPSSVFDYDVTTRALTLKKETPVLGGYDRTQYRAERVEATAADGAKIPISLVYKIDASTPDGRPKNAPTLLRGYGSYGISNDPYFSVANLSLLDRGMVVAVAHIRGGGELGRPWYTAGKYLNKKNTFTDFITCAEHLIRDGWTASDRLAIWGGSAGGLLMGAVINMRPELFKAAVASVPFVDVLTTMLDETIPLTVTEWEEWGNPKTNPTYYTYMKSYSPYDNIKPQAYPHLLITAGLNDPRVAFWEPAKWTAKLRATKTDQHDLLLKTNMGAGHGGASGRYERYKEIALEYAFVLKHVGR